MANNVGVFVQRGTAGPLPFGPDPGDSVFLAITSSRGASNVPTLITSMSRYRQAFGSDSSVSEIVAEIMFSKGVRRMYVARVVGDGALSAHVVLQDGSAADTLRVEAKGEGTWANTFDIVVSAGTSADTKQIVVRDAADTVLETWDNVKLDEASIARVNDTSDYIRLVDLGSATAAPGNLPADGTFVLGSGQAGADGSAPDAAAIVGTENAGVKTGLKVFRDRRLGRGFLLAPDLDSDATVRSEMVAQLAYFHVPMFSGPAEGTTPTAALSDITSARDTVSGGYYYPRAKARGADGSVKTVPIVGHVVADWLNAIAESGPGKAPAGKDFRIDYVLGLETQANGQPLVDEATAELLVAAGINPAYDNNGSGPKVWGARSASTDASWQYLHSVYLYCLIGSRVQEALDDLVYDVADDLFFNQLRMGVRQFMVSLHGQRAFNGEVQPDGESYNPSVHGFGVQADADLLSASDVANGIVRVKIVFRPARTAETINVEVSKQNEV